MNLLTLALAVMATTGTASAVLYAARRRWALATIAAVAAASPLTLAAWLEVAR